jgi:hypothetical protein
VDASSINVKLTLTDVRLADVLDAIVLVADHPIKYSVLDYGIVFSAKGPESPQLETRTFKVDPNTFVQGLESVGAQSFGSANSSGGGSGGGSSGGSGGGGGSGGNQNGGASVAVVNAFPGASQYRSTGQGWRRRWWRRWRRRWRRSGRQWWIGVCDYGTNSNVNVSLGRRKVSSRRWG